MIQGNAQVLVGSKGKKKSVADLLTGDELLEPLSETLSPVLEITKVGFWSKSHDIGRDGQNHLISLPGKPDRRTAVASPVIVDQQQRVFSRTPAAPQKSRIPIYDWHFAYQLANANQAKRIVHRGELELFSIRTSRKIGFIANGVILETTDKHATCDLLDHSPISLSEVRNCIPCQHSLTTEPSKSSPSNAANQKITSFSQGEQPSLHKETIQFDCFLFAY